MRDSFWLYQADVKDRRREARGARHKKGLKKKGCTLPSDALTPAQWRKLNGPVKIIREAKEQQ